MVERRDELEVLREEHPVPEDVARHVADPDGGDRLGGDVAAKLAEVALHALPSALRGDAERLVVVPIRPARRVRVAEPEPVLLRDGVRGVGQVRRALVGRDHQVGVVAVEHPHALGMHDLAPDDVVGDIEEAAHQGDVLALLLLHQPGAVERRALQDEPALGADRDDHGVLHHLRLHQAQDLGAVVLEPVRPADAAAGDHAAAEVHAGHLGREHEDLPQRHRLGHPRDVDAAQLERQMLAVGQIRARPHRREDHAQVPPQDAVVVQALNGVQVGPDLVDERELGGLVAGRRRIEPELEEPDQLARDGEVPHEAVVLVARREGGAEQLPVLPVRAQDRDPAPVELAGDDQPVQPVRPGPPLPDGADRVGDDVRHPLEVELLSGRAEHAEVVQVAAVLTGADKPRRHLLDDGQAELLEQRQEVRQRRLAPRLVQLEPGQRLDGALLVLERDHVRPVGAEALELLDVERGLVDRPRPTCSSRGTVRRSGGRARGRAPRRAWRRARPRASRPSSGRRRPPRAGARPAAGRGCRPPGCGS